MNKGAPPGIIRASKKPIGELSFNTLIDAWYYLGHLGDLRISFVFPIATFPFFQPQKRREDASMVRWRAALPR